MLGRSMGTGVCPGNRFTLSLNNSIQSATLHFVYLQLCQPALILKCAHTPLQFCHPALILCCTHTSLLFCHPALIIWCITYLQLCHSALVLNYAHTISIPPPLRSKCTTYLQLCHPALILLDLIPQCIHFRLKLNTLLFRVLHAFTRQHVSPRVSGSTCHSV